MKEICPVAVSGNSPNDTFMQDEIESLYRFITSKDHLQRNIKNIKMNYLSTKYIRNSFEHLVEVKLFVNTDQLWESPRNYIWKHLGNDSVWTRGNGTEIRLTRIHQVYWFSPPSYILDLSNGSFSPRNNVIYTFNELLIYVRNINHNN